MRGSCLRRSSACAPRRRRAEHDHVRAGAPARAASAVVAVARDEALEAGARARRRAGAPRGRRRRSTMSATRSPASSAFAVVGDGAARRRRAARPRPRAPRARAASSGVLVALRRGRRRVGQQEGERSTPSPSVLVHPDLAAEQARDLAADRQPEARAAVAAARRAVGLLEGLEDQPQLVLGDADAGVGDGEGDRVRPAAAVAARRSAPTVSRTLPFSVNLSALESRLRSTWATRCSSVTIASGDAVGDLDRRTRGPSARRPGRNARSRPASMLGDVERRRVRPPSCPPRPWTGRGCRRSASAGRCRPG